MLGCKGLAAFQKPVEICIKLIKGISKIPKTITTAMIKLVLTF